MLLYQSIIRGSFTFYDINVAIRTNVNTSVKLFLFFVQDISKLGETLSNYVLFFFDLTGDLFLLVSISIDDSTQ
jgi:hypothetical protein